MAILTVIVILLIYVLFITGYLLIKYIFPAIAKVIQVIFCILGILLLSLIGKIWDFFHSL